MSIGPDTPYLEQHTTKGGRGSLGLQQATFGQRHSVVTNDDEVIQYAYLDERQRLPELSALLR